MKTIKRNEIAQELTWDLDPIFSSDENWEKEFELVEKEIPTLKEKIDVMLESGDKLLALFEADEAIVRRVYNLYIYSHLKLDEDTANTKYQGYFAKVMNLYSSYGATTSSITPIILTKNRNEIDELVAQNEKLNLYTLHFDRIFREKAHSLSKEEEALLANAADLIGSSGRSASTLMNADLKHPMILDEEGNEIRITNGVYAKLLESKDRNKRKEVFEKLYSSFDGVKNTLANTLYTNTKKNVFYYKTRKYNSSREMFLSGNEVPESVYDNLLSAMNDKLHLLHRYVDLRAKVLNIDEVNAYDMYVPIVEEIDTKFTIEKAKEITLKALAPLGEEYLSILEKAFNERWIDWIENEGKRTGAYSSGGYDTKPYILMNWQDSIDQLYTLVHELGHSVHSYYSRNTQPFIYHGYPIFLAEIASTTNENLLTTYLLKTETDPKVIAYVINHYLDGVKGTMFRQTQFAEFEYEMHKLVEAGTPLTHENLSELYASINSKYYGPKMNSNNEIKLEWARIPHFYTSFYVFQYATGFAAASTLAKRIINQEENALENYLSFLKAGCSDSPINIMKKAGVDMTSKQYIEEALAIFETSLKNLEDILLNK